MYKHLQFSVIVNFAEAIKDVDNRDPDIPCSTLTVRRYVTTLPEEDIKLLLSLKHRLARFLFSLKHRLVRFLFSLKFVF